MNISHVKDFLKEDPKNFPHTANSLLLLSENPNTNSKSVCMEGIK